MSKLHTACIALLIAASGGAALAQSSSGSMSSGAMAPGGSMSSMHMTKSQMAMMNKCKAMSHTAMMKNAGCVKMMKVHPDMMKGGDDMSNGAMPH